VWEPQNFDFPAAGFLHLFPALVLAAHRAFFFFLAFAGMRFLTPFPEKNMVESPGCNPGESREPMGLR